MISYLLPSNVICGTEKISKNKITLSTSFTVHLPDCKTLCINFLAHTRIYKNICRKTAVVFTGTIQFTVPLYRRKFNTVVLAYFF